VVIIYTLFWYGSIGYFFFNFNTFTLAEKLTIILIISGVNLLSFINGKES